VPAFVATRESGARQGARPRKPKASPVTARDNYFMAEVIGGAAQWPLSRQRCGEPRPAKRPASAPAYEDLCEASPITRIEPVFPAVGGKTVRAGSIYRGLPRAAGVPVREICFPAWTPSKELFVGPQRRPLAQRGVAVAGARRSGARRNAAESASPVSTENWTTIGKGRGRLAAGAARNRSGRRIGNLLAKFRVLPSPPSVTASGARASWLYRQCGPASARLSIRSSRRPRRTFKKRFSTCPGFTDEAAFDDFQTLTWEGHAEKIRVPYLCVAGERRELKPAGHNRRACWPACGGAAVLVI